MSFLFNDLLQLISSNYIIFLLFTSYILGSIPFGVIITNIFGYGDIRKIGSGNIGATNVLRTGNKLLAFLTLILDLLKSLAILFIIKITLSNSLNNDVLITLYILSSFFSILGHMYSPFLRFNGGKGIATSAGVLLFISYPIAILTSIIWSLIALGTKKSSLGALFASLSSLIFLWSFQQMSIAEVISKNYSITNKELYLFLVITIAIWLKHIPNIKRLINNTESEIK